MPDLPIFYVLIWQHLYFQEYQGCKDTCSEPFERTTQRGTTASAMGHPLQGIPCSVWKASIFRRQQNGHVGSMHSRDSSSNKLQKALEVEPRLKENHVVAFSHLQNMGLHTKKSMVREAREGKLLQEKL